MKKVLSLILSIAVIVNLFTVICEATQIEIHDKSSYYVDEYFEHVYTMYHSFMT